MKKNLGLRVKTRGNDVKVIPMVAGIEVNGTCGKCGKTIYLRVPPNLAKSFQGCDKACCPGCYPDGENGFHTNWYLKEEIDV